MRAMLLTALLLPCVAIGADLETRIADAVRENVAWKDRLLPGRWETVNANPRIESLRSPPMVFGVRPQRVFAYCTDDRLSQIYIVYLELGYSINLWKEVKDWQKKRFEADSQKVAEKLPGFIGRWTNTPGEVVRTSAGTDAWAFDVTEYVIDGVSFRLFVEPGRAVCLVVSRRFEGDTDLFTVSSLPERAAALRANVVRNDDGDVVVGNVPAIDQDGRPYCGPAVWTTIARYYGLNVFQEMMLTGGRDGGHDIQSAARISADHTTNFDFENLKRSIDAGHLVWFSEPGHVALITSYNDRTREIFRTDTWGPENKHKRVPLSDFLKTTNGFIHLTPEE